MERIKILWREKRCCGEKKDAVERRKMLWREERYKVELLQVLVANLIH